MSRYAKIASALATALLAGALICPGALAQGLSVDEMIHALTTPPRTRGLSASTQPAQSQADRAFVKSLPRTRSLTLTERERAVAVIEKSPRVDDAEVYFELDSSEITDKAEPVLAKLGKALASAELKGAAVLINGYCDATGTAEYNQRLSERRAEAIKRYLVDNFRVPAANLVTAGYGKTHLKNPDAPYAAENRRVQVVNVGAEKEANR